MMKIDKAPVPLIVPNPDDPRLTQSVAGTDQTGARVEIKVPMERPLTLYLNAQEIVTMMTIGDYPEYLALGYLLNQNMLKYNDVVTEVEYDDDLQVVVVRTEHHTNFEAKLKKRTQTSGCAQGTAFGDLLEAVESVALPKAELRTSWLYQMTQTINTMPSLYLEAGAIHGCVLCKEGEPLCYTEDVGRHNAVDKIAGWMYRHGVDPLRQDPLHHGTPHLGDGDQDGADGHSDPGVALRLHRLGRRSRQAGRADAGRTHARKALHRARGRGAHRLRPEPRLRRGGVGETQAQG
ncbi:formate dehydrogenase accessory protein FdhD [Bradyrhizobium sp. USDA 376]